MSDNNSQTDNPDNQNEQSTPPQGGWRQPEKVGGWKTPEPKKEQGGWQSLPALPRDLEQEPQDTGGWHRPQPEQTIFSDEDEIEVSSPSDELLELAKNVDYETGRPPDQPRALAPEDQLFSLAAESASDMEVPQSPEDLMALLDVIEESEEDLSETAGVRSELFALASLVDDASPEAIEQISSDDADEFDDYSPGLAEQALLQGQDQDAGGVDPGDYARSLLEELEGDDLGAVDYGTGAEAPAGDGTSDPADYARSLLEELEGDPFGGTSATPPPVDTSPVDPRQEELARQFRQTEEEVHALRQRLRNGEITNDQYRQMLQEHMVLDDDQVYWMMAEDSDQWFKYINDSWVPAEPPRSQAADDALSASAFGFSEYELPAEDIPTSDPDMTQLGQGFFDNTMAAQDQPLDFQMEETVPASAGYGSNVGGTMAYPGMADEEGIEGAIDASEPPDVESEQETPLADEARERQQSRMLSGAIFGVLILVGIVALLGVGVFFLASSWYSGVIDKYEAQIVGLQNYTPEFQAVRLLDARGDLITVISRDGEERITVQLDDIAPVQIHAVISAENPTFYQDPGWSFTDSISGFFSSLGGDIPSIQTPTITEQLARNLIVGTAGDQSNLETTAVAGELTNRYSKEFLLELYLNETFFGNQSYGVESAAQFYFDETSGSVNLPQAALIAGLIDDTVQFDPVTNREASFARMEQVLDAMVETGCLNMTHGPGQVCVSQADRETPQVIFANSQVRIREYEPRTFDVPYPHFVSLVRAQLESAVPDLWSMGLVVRTTLIPNVQERMERSLARRVEDLRDAGISTGAMIWTDPETGAIRGYVGSPDYNNAEVNGSTDFARQYIKPGEVIMPIVYAGALDGVDKNGNGGLDPNEYYTAATITWNVPSQLPNPDDPNGSIPIQPRGTIGPAPVRQALQSIYHVPAAEAYEFIGRDKFVEMANGMGDLYTKVDPTFSWRSAIGETAVRLNDMMTAYGTIANGGVRRSVYAIESIEDGSGNVLAMPEPLLHTEERIIPEGVAFILQNIMSDDTARDLNIFGNPTGLTINELSRNNQVAATMGSPEDRTGYWTMGFTENAVVGVWLGRHDGGSIPNETARTSAVPLWNEVMSLIVATEQNEGNGPGQFARPSSVTVQTICPDTGNEYANCAVAQRNEFFAQTRRAPAETIVVQAAVNTWTRLLANEFCSSQQDTVVQTFANISNPYAVEWLRGPGQSYAARIGLQPNFAQRPTAACDQNTRLPTVNISQPTNNQQVQGNIPILGQVSAPDNFDRYQLEFSIAGQNAYTLLPGMPSNVQQPNPGSQLATWDTQTVIDNRYDLRLAVFANDGGYIFRSVQVVIDNPDPTATPTPIPTFTPIPLLPTTTPIPLDPLNNQNDFNDVPTFTPDPF